MLEAAKTELFNPLVPKAQNTECQNLLFLLQIKPVSQLVKSICGLLFFAPSAIIG